MFGTLEYTDLQNGFTTNYSVGGRDSLKITDELEYEYRRLCGCGQISDGATIRVVAIIDGEPETVIRRKHFGGHGWVDYNSHLYRQLECV